MKSLQRFFEAKGCYLFGAGPASDEVLHFIRSRGLPVLGYCDNADGKWGSLRNGIPVLSPTALAERLGPQEQVCISCSQQQAVAHQLLRAGIAEDCIYPYLSSMFSSYYDRDLLTEHASDIAELRSAAIDQESKDYLDRLVAFRADMNPFHLAGNPLVTGVYQYHDLWSRLPSHPVLLDVGAFTGDTARLFLERTEGRAELFSFEPWAPNFRCLEGWIRDHHLQAQVHAENVLIGSSNSMSRAVFTGDSEEADRRASEFHHTAGDESLCMESISLDHYFRRFPEKKIDFIKMDIEGAELQALDGAKDLIQRDRPILAISGYHEPAHLWEIPQLVQKHFPFYRMAIGHDFRVHFEVEFYFFPA